MLQLLVIEKNTISNVSKRVVFVLLSIQLLSLCGFSQSSCMVSGYVINSTNNEALIGALIINHDSQELVVTNDFGYYTIMSEVADSITIEYVGFRPERLKALCNQSRTTEMKAIAQTVVTIGATRKKVLESSKSNRETINAQQIRQRSFVAGEADVMQAIQSLSGISNTRDGMSGIVVRGGLPDQNLLLLDGVRLYNYTHLLGFLSFFNADMINNVEVYKGAFPAKYGGKASSIININMIDGDASKTYGKFGIGLVSSRLFYNRPVIKDKWSFSMGMRLSYLDIVTIPQRLRYNAGETDNSGRLNLNDITLKSKLKLSKDSDLTVSLLRTRDVNDRYDRFGEQEDIFSRSWTNHLISIQYHTPFGNKRFLSLTGGYYHYDFNYRYDVENPSFYSNELSQSSIHEYSLLADMSDYISNQVKLNYGLQYFRTQLSPLSYRLDATTDGFEGRIPERISSEYVAYTSVDFENPLINLSIGARVSWYTINANQQILLLPRIKLQRDFGKLSTEIAFDGNNQNAFQITPISVNAPIEIWLQSQQNMANSYQTSLSMSYPITDQLNVHISAYKKRISNIVDLAKVYDRFDRSLLELERFVLDDGIIDAQGIDISMDYSKSKLDFNGTISYTKSTTQFANVNDGNPYPTNFRRSLNLGFNASYQLHTRLYLSVNVIYQTGQPITLPVNSYFDEYGGQEYIFKDRNNGTYPYYMRVDIAAVWKRSDRSNFSFNVYNLLNRRNPFHIYLEEWRDNQVFSSSRYRDIILFRILPTIAYERSF